MGAPCLFGRFVRDVTCARPYRRQQNPACLSKAVCKRASINQTTPNDAAADRARHRPTDRPTDERSMGVCIGS